MLCYGHRIVQRAAAPSPRIILAVLSLGGISYALLQSLVVPALPEIQQSLHTTESAVGWVLTAYLLSASVATPIIGRLGDMYGKERLLMIVLFTLAFGTLISGVASSLWLMLAGRVIQGAGGGIFPLAFSIIRDEFPNERVPGAIGLVSSLLGIGGGAGVVFAGVVTQQLNYHWLFWFPLGLIVATAYLTWRYIPESPVKTPADINYRAAALMTLGISAVLLAITETSTWGWGSPKTLTLLAIGTLVIAAWVREELRSREPLVDMRMMAIRGVWTTNTVAFLIGVGMYSSFVLLPELVQEPASTGYGFGASVTVAGLFLLPSTIAIVVVGQMAGRLDRRIGSRGSLIWGTLFALASYVLLVADRSQEVDIYIAAGLLGIGIGLSFAAMANLIVQNVRREQTGVATGMNAVTRTLGGAFGAQVAATLLASNLGAGGHPTASGFTLSFLMCLIALAGALGFALAVPRRSANEVAAKIARAAA
ncbi:MAG: MFS transporter [Candidatus Rokuibacteriota bacterium]|nr:MAG: MFS transporter [Candidatus Rokubacteria bacterium]